MNEAATQKICERPFPKVTTQWVLAELGNFVAATPDRRRFEPFVRKISVDARFLIVPADGRLFEAGLRLYAARRDKNWSLIDCISFVVMEELRLDQTLTADHHFEQAGFKVVLF
ncbi:MAG: type II toxin-antitoxin system VapC family toxin [Candidatus Hydrogenedentes bacterium]|nr:type II toxin-antitoxin system VapC family toxin [Candidatus Hydrogenedentota bacterium]